MVKRLLDAGIQPVLVKENYLLEIIPGRNFQDYIDEVEVISQEF